MRTQVPAVAIAAAMLSVSPALAPLSLGGGGLDLGVSLGGDNGVNVDVGVDLGGEGVSASM